MNLASAQRWALFFYFFSINFEIYDPFNTGGMFSASKLTAAIYLVTILPKIPYFLNGKGLKKFLIPAWSFFAFLTLISALNINHISSSFIHTTLFLNILLFWIIINHERKEPGVLRKAFMWFAFGSLALTGFYYFGIGVEVIGGRVTIFGDNQNATAIRVSVSIVVLIISAIEKSLLKSNFRLLFLLPTPLMLFLVIESGSRTAFLSLGLALALVVVLFKDRNILKKILMLGFGIISGYLIFERLQEYETMSTRLMSTFEQGDLAGRDQIWQSIIPIIKENLFFGVGKTGYEAFSLKYFGSFTSPHNAIIEVLALTGLIGLILYLRLLFLVVFETIKCYLKRNNLLPLLLLVFYSGMVIASHPIKSKIAWAILAFAASTVFYQKRNIVKP